MFLPKLPKEERQCRRRCCSLFLLASQHYPASSHPCSARCSTGQVTHGQALFLAVPSARILLFHNCSCELDAKCFQVDYAA